MPILAGLQFLMASIILMGRKCLPGSSCTYDKAIFNKKSKYCNSSVMQTESRAESGQEC